MASGTVKPSLDPTLTVCDPLGTPQLPIVPQLQIEVEHKERERLRQMAMHLLANDPSLAAVPFKSDVSSGLNAGASLLFEDHSALTAVDPEEGMAFACRSLLLAGKGDLMIIDGGRHVDFERYCRDTLGLGSVDIAIACHRKVSDPAHS